MTPCVKHLLIISVLFFIATIVLATARDINLYQYLALYYIGGDNFRPWQIITHMFMHGNIAHIFCNMFALWMFGRALESVWGSKRFLLYYLLCSIGAALCHTAYLGISTHHIYNAIQAFNDAPSPEALIVLYNDHFQKIMNPEWLTQITNLWRSDTLHSSEYAREAYTALMDLYNTILNNSLSVGASGAIYGILLAFGMLFPNEIIYINFLAPVKAKWYVIIFAVLELYTGIRFTHDGIGHFAHLGGMVSGFILILIWRRRDLNKYWHNPQ